MAKRTLRDAYDLVLEGDAHRVTKRLNEKKPYTNNSFWYVYGLVGNIGLTIAVPIVIGALVGRWIDSKFVSYPVWTLTGIISGVVISLFSLVTLFRRLYKELNK